jgi:hypothetical protein
MYDVPINIKLLFMLADIMLFCAWLYSYGLSYAVCNFFLYFSHSMFEMIKEFVSENQHYY